MSAFLDTSMLVRYLTGEPSDLADRAASIIDSEEGLQVTDVALAETAYVLTSVYQVPRAVVVDHLVALLQKENLSPYALRKDFVLRGLLLCRPSGRVSFADALIWASARSAGAPVIYSLDRRFPAEGIEVRAQP